MKSGYKRSLLPSSSDPTEKQLTNKFWSNSIYQILLDEYITEICKVDSCISFLSQLPDLFLDLLDKIVHETSINPYFGH